MSAFSAPRSRAHDATEGHDATGVNVIRRRSPNYINGTTGRVVN